MFPHLRTSAVMASVVVASTAVGFALATVLQPAGDIVPDSATARLVTASPASPSRFDRQLHPAAREILVMKSRAIFTAAAFPGGNSPAVNAEGPRPATGHVNLGFKSRDIVSACQMRTTG